jgi:hypothetical protein
MRSHAETGRMQSLAAGPTLESTGSAYSITNETHSNFSLAGNHGTGDLG